jgi:lysyl-tRNA synthetase class 2
VSTIQESDQIVQRRANLEALKQLGVDVYPHRFDASATINAVVGTHGQATARRSRPNHVRERVAGRILGVRTFGKANFLVLSDGVSRLQVYVRQDSVPERAFQIFKLLDFGDWVGVEGRLFRTKTNELTVWVSDLTFLSKCLLPLPEKWHGLTDIETRYRQRYLDLTVNPDSRRVFEVRSRVISTIRQFLVARGFLEVETPMMQSIAGGALARPFTTHHNALDIPLYLRIAPELYLKRLTVGGIERVFEINRNFRNEGISTQHNPEFTMLEFYWSYADYRDLMTLTEQMLADTAQAALGGLEAPFGDHVISFKGPFRRLSLREAAAGSRHRPGSARRSTCRCCARGTAARRWRSGWVWPSSRAWARARLRGPLRSALRARAGAADVRLRFPTEVSPLSKQRATIPTRWSASSSTSAASRWPTPSAS